MAKTYKNVCDIGAKIRLNGLTARLPLSWQQRLIALLGKPRTWWDMTVFEDRVSMLCDAERGGLRMDSNDTEICEAAEVTARDFERRLGLCRRIAEAKGWGPEWVEAYASLCARDLLDARGLLDMWPDEKRSDRAGRLKRLGDPLFWRAALRKLHARTVEACNIDLGMVGQHAGCYVSDDAVRQRRGQRSRNAAVLESLTAVNDLGQVTTVAELCAKGTGNPAIRRVELLTRIAGFELIAKRLGHTGVMVTMTCPSRFHKMTTRKGRAVPNPRYAGSKPKQAQEYLSKTWAACRAAAARQGVEWYGFRIAEPQHDSTPHWHTLIFFAPKTVDVVTERVNRAGVTVRKVKPGGRDAEAVMQSLVRRYFLENDSPDEAGAEEHRVDFERIDWSKGSAVGYVIKYVSKNIDGFGVGRDLLGNDAISSSQRVEAWASTWRIRQFQQIGGAPVGVWRELRRINPDNVSSTAPDSLRVAVSAVNAAKVEPGVQSIAWMRYTDAQGGIGTKRKCMRLKLMKRPQDLGRYGEQKPPAPIGIHAEGTQLFRNHVHAMNPALPSFERKSFASVESERCEWIVMPGARADVERVAAFGRRQLF